MKIITTLVLATGLLLAACSLKKNNNDSTNRTLQRITKYSNLVNDTFYIDIQLPAGYFENPEKRYPAVFLLDGNFYFPMMSSVTTQYEKGGLLDPAIVVGIGYKSFKLMDSLRVRDYLYPTPLPSDEIEHAGGGLRFYDFITQELIPAIDKEYRTMKEERTLAGHSFGGYFVLYSLLHQLQQNQHSFRTFISASPSVWYNNFYLKQLPAQLEQTNDSLRVFLTVGSQEDSTWTVKPVQALAAEIQKRNIPALNFKSRTYPFDHMDNALPSLTMGLRELSEKRTD